MKRRFFYWFLLLFFARSDIYAQPGYSPDYFASVDSFVQTVKYQNDFEKLAADLTDPFVEDVKKTRAIFKWITNNITYDYRFINRGGEIEKPECSGEEPDCAGVFMKWQTDYLRKVLRTRKAVADGYSRLFKMLCDYAYIQCEIIPGYARTKPYQIGNNMGVNHSWNAVLIDTSWYYLDATWAAGTVIEDEETGRLLKFVKDYKEYYWLSTFDRFSRNHYPQTGKWVERPAISKEQFFNRPHYFSVEVLENLTEENPRTGVLKVKNGDTIHFRFNYKKEIRLLQVNSNNFRNPPLWTTVSTGKRKSQLVRDTWAEKKQVYLPFTRKGDNYSFDYVVKENSLYYLEIVFDYKPAIRYRVRVDYQVN